MTSDDASTSWDETDYSDEVSPFGDRIAVARTARNMTQSQLARRMGIKAQTLVNWENDRSEPRANQLQMLAGLLNVSIIWLMSGEGDAPVCEPETDAPGPQRIDALVQEIRDIRASQSALATRLGRLEKRLRALGDEG